MTEGLPINGQCELIKDWQDARYYMAFVDTWYCANRGKVLDIFDEEGSNSPCVPVFGWSEQCDGKVIKRMIAYRHLKLWAGQQEWWVFNVNDKTCWEAKPREALKMAWGYIPKDDAAMQYLKGMGLFMYE